MLDKHISTSLVTIKKFLDVQSGTPIYIFIMAVILIISIHVLYLIYSYERTLLKCLPVVYRALEKQLLSPDMLPFILEMIDSFEFVDQCLQRYDFVLFMNSSIALIFAMAIY